MYRLIKFQYSDADEFSMPLMAEAMSKSAFMAHVREAVETRYIRTRTMLHNYRMYANILEHYLTKHGIDEVMPSESFIQTMWDRLKENGDFQERSYEWGTRKKVPRFTRKIINEHFYPNGLVKRKLLKEIVIGRYERYFKITQNSQEAIKWFEQNGKRVEAKSVYVQNGDEDIDLENEVIKTIHRVTNRELLPLTKNSKIEHALRFLEYVNLNGFEEATKEHVQKFEEACRNRGVKQVQDYLAHVATFYINIRAKGFIKSNPFAHVSLKMDGGAVKKDFISVEGMQKIRDLSTLDRSDKDAVRDRLFALLGYDLALRIGELLSLKVSDFRKDGDGEWFVLIRSEIQKGHKDEEVMYLFFEETKELLHLYIHELRDKYRPTTDHLILSNQWGRALTAQPCATRFKELCQKLDIKTYYGNAPSPHLLRHSFATLNIEPIGLSLPLYDMIQRLRHTRVETTRKHYIHNNPYLKKIKHDVYRKNVKKKTAMDIFSEASLPDLEHWLSAKVGVNSATIRDVRENHRKVFANSSQETKVDKTEVDNKIYQSDVFITEAEALERVKLLGIPALALRKYAKKQRAISQSFAGSFRYGKSFKYREELIDDLSRNWISSEELRNKLGLKRITFWRRAKDEKWRDIKIGQSRYIHRLDY